MRITGRAAALFTLLATTHGGPGAAARPARHRHGLFPASLHPLIGGQSSRDYLLGAARRRVTNLDGDGRNICQLCTEIPTVANGRVKLVDLPEGGKGMEATFTLRPT